MKVSDLIQELATQLGWPTLQPDTAGRYELAFENNITVEIFAAEDGSNEIIFQGMVLSQLPQDETEANTFLGHILDLNYGHLLTQKEVLSLAPPQDQLILWRRLTSQEQSNVQEFSVTLESFLNKLDYWIQICKLDRSSKTTSVDSALPIPSRFSSF